MENVSSQWFRVCGVDYVTLLPRHPGAGQTDRYTLANLSWLCVSEICESLHIQSMGLTTTHTLTSTAGSLHVAEPRSLL